MLSLRYYLVYYSLLSAWTIQFAAPQLSDDFQSLICRGIPNLSEEQIQMCIEVPQAISKLQTTEGIFRSECQWQFRRELWNCSGSGMPVFSEPKLAGKLVAFVSYIAISYIHVLNDRGTSLQ